MSFDLQVFFLSLDASMLIYLNSLYWNYQKVHGILVNGLMQLYLFSFYRKHYKLQKW